MGAKILILSKETDLSTVRVMKWILFFGEKKIFRINQEDEILIKKISISGGNTFKIKVGKRELVLSREIKFWFRRGYVNLKSIDTQSYSDFFSSFRLNDFLDKESIVIKKFIYSVFDALKTPINSHSLRFMNKIEVLREASKNGLLVPDYMITTQKKDICNFFNIYNAKGKKIITKSIADIFSVNVSNIGTFRTYTQIVNEDTLVNMEDVFFSFTSTRIH